MTTGIRHRSMGGEGGLLYVVCNIEGPEIDQIANKGREGRELVTLETEVGK